ncbi:MAG: flavin reductase family protein [Pseudomonadota bacterium]
MNMQAAQGGFQPQTFDTKQLRGAFSRFATGVAIVTTMTKDGPVGMTINSFTSVSLEPALCLWSIEHSSTRFEAFENTTFSAIHVLRRDQEDLCMAFAKPDGAFAATDWIESAHGAPLLTNCLARFECQRDATHLAGDHTILVDRVLGIEANDGEPLVFNQGAFGRFQKG